MNTFLTDYQMASLVEAIQTAENHSTGEIRVHIDATTEGHNAEIAFEVFKRLCKDKTVEKNAVLFHVNFEQQYLTIIGDEGIHKKVHQSFWDHMHDEITTAFSKGKYFDGLKKAILETGIELKNHFPIVGENPNELPNEITFS
ncbi:MULTISPECIES: TPM domain-containing protein [unclassified Kaistella]|uniref:TPM domain-containing protein n=1 Tax=unclassified Kaistella TaxID=2762626 RepID=UPI0027348A10|nr:MULTISPECIES: TPM domain-containing protein [unclassified Kaistella]MCZ2083246.1 TPM domain-containing protein [Flavobacteriales bacterium]MDP2454244.1 TPM domain-containing protein [Kaistella sp. SH11-4b]MDP2457685.1 TPM domain-containing protein [Kaistella sp. SH40-3]MDP2460443.1 TPM domain-containing protein [Kaistella sp. SH19-2b]